MARNSVLKKWFKSPVKTAFSILLLTGLVVGGLSFPHYGVDFWGNVLVEAHGMLMDIAIIGILILWLDQRRDKALQAERYIDAIDDFREWKSEEATYRIVGNIKRLAQIGITEIDLYNCFLKKANLSGFDLKHCSLWGADLGNANLRAAILKDSKIGGAYLGDAILRGVDLRNADLQRSRCMRTDFRGADLRGASLIRTTFREALLRGADLRNADANSTDFTGSCLRQAKLHNVLNLTPEQLMKACDLRTAHLDEHLREEILDKKPELLSQDMVPCPICEG